MSDFSEHFKNSVLVGAAEDTIGDAGRDYGQGLL